MKICVNNLSVVLHKKKILNQLNCVFDSHIYGLMGANGSGKTTFIRTILGLYKPNRGTIKAIKDENEENIEHLHIGYLPQTFDVFKDLTVYDQLKYFCILKEIDDENIDSEINRVLELTNLVDKRDEKCKRLSGGMIRRLGIAQALLGTPEMIILDEPTSGLDPNERFRFKEIIRQLKIDIPVILSTHIIEDISSLCSELIFLDKGEIKYIGSIEEITNSLNNKVYKCPISMLSNIQENVIVVHEQNNYVKIIADENLDYEFLTKESILLEDIYLYLSHMK